MHDTAQNVLLATCRFRHTAIYSSSANVIWVHVYVCTYIWTQMTLVLSQFLFAMLAGVLRYPWSVLRKGSSCQWSSCTDVGWPISVDTMFSGVHWNITCICSSRPALKICADIYRPRSVLIADSIIRHFGSWLTLATILGNFISLTQDFSQFIVCHCLFQLSARVDQYTVRLKCECGSPSTTPYCKRDLTPGLVFFNEVTCVRTKGLSLPRTMTKEGTNNDLGSVFIKRPFALERVRGF